MFLCTLSISRTEITRDCFFAKILSNKCSLTAKAIKDHLIHIAKHPPKDDSVFANCIASTSEYSAYSMRDDKYTMYIQEYKTLITPITCTSKCKDPNDIVNKLSKKNAYTIYTDGSKVKDNLYNDSARICPDLDICIQRSLNKKTSVYTAECIALDDAFEIAVSNRDKKFLTSEGIRGNEKVDQHGKIATCTKFLERNQVPYTDLKESFKKDLNS
ncbi:hypothetical protein TSAR_008014 [Trichomalopsis sarcophagae]|uniref:Uncharacterized protein n=1 Tax=Trichomalopsis sarcophagae TaxID=543379 RepID=A0A232FNX0_9HYME|nr:hypothetical protein TSAR_008014 [Trichomalopsis sarcophagae]